MDNPIYVREFNDEYKPCYYDIANEFMADSYDTKIDFPLKNHVNSSEIPELYFTYIKGIEVLNQNKKLTTNKLSVSLINILRDVIVGGYFNIGINEVDVGDIDDYETTLESINKDSKEIVKQTVYNAEMYGSSCLVKVDIENGEKFRVESPLNYFYNEYSNKYYSSYPIIKEDGKANYVDETRYIKNNYLFIETYDRETSETIVKKITLSNKESNKDKLHINVIKNGKYKTLFGESTLEPVINDIKDYEMTTNALTVLMYKTRPKTYVSNEAIEIDENGRPIFDETQDVHVVLDTMGMDEMGKMVQMEQYDFPVQEFNDKREFSINTILTKIQLDRQVVAFDSNGGVEKSATEINSENTTMISMIENKRDSYLEDLNELINFFNSRNDLQIEFIPYQHLNYSQVSTNISTLFPLGLISREQAVRMLNPRMSDQQIKEEIDRIENDIKDSQEVDTEKIEVKEEEKIEENDNEE